MGSQAPTKPPKDDGRERPVSPPPPPPPKTVLCYDHQSLPPSGKRIEAAVHQMLTPRELRLLDEINAVYAGFLAIAKESQDADGFPAYNGDSLELGWHIHMLQNWVLSQAAARAYPGKFRRVGCGHMDQAALDAGEA